MVTGTFMAVALAAYNVGVFLVEKRNERQAKENAQAAREAELLGTIVELKAKVGESENL